MSTLLFLHILSIKLILFQMFLIKQTVQQYSTLCTFNWPAKRHESDISSVKLQEVVWTLM